MSCTYKEDCDKCSMFCVDNHQGLDYINSEYGFSADGKGECSVYDDPDPYIGCCLYEPVDE